MRRKAPEAVWIIQGWQRNPMRDLLEGLEHGEAIILDLMACERPQWGGIKNSLFYKAEGHMHHDWIWCALPNFGGKTGLHGKMSSYASGQKPPVGKKPMWNRNSPRGNRYDSRRI